MQSAHFAAPTRPIVGRLFEGNATKLEPLYDRLFPTGCVDDEQELAARFGLTVREADLDSDVLYAVYFADLERVVINTRLCRNDRIRRFAFLHEIGHRLLDLGYAPWARGHDAVEAFCDGFACLALGLDASARRLTLDQL